MTLDVPVCLAPVPRRRRAVHELGYVMFGLRECALLVDGATHDPAVDEPMLGGRRVGEVATYDSPAIALSQLHPSAEVMAPNAYGGDHVLENAEGAGGLLTSAQSLARFIGSHAVWDVGPRQVATRYGTLDGSCTGAVSRADGLDVGYLFNRRVTDAEHDQITAAMNTVIDHHGPTW